LLPLAKRETQGAQHGGAESSEQAVHVEEGLRLLFLQLSQRFDLGFKNVCPEA
jgi:hypothetical protein